MHDAVTWTMSQYVVLLLLVGVFGIIGFVRGIRRELIVFGALVVGAAVLGLAGESIARPVNRLYDFQRFFFAGGAAAEDPAMVWRQVSEAPALIDTERGLDRLKVAIFGITGLAGYLLGEKLRPPAFGLPMKALGLIMGLLNGVVVAYFAFPILFPEPTAVIMVPSGEVHQTLASPDFRAHLIVLFIVVLVAFGLVSASGRAQRGS